MIKDFNKSNKNYEIAKSITNKVDHKLIKLSNPTTM